MRGGRGSMAEPSHRMRHERGGTSLLGRLDRGLGLIPRSWPPVSRIVGIRGSAIEHTVETLDGQRVLRPGADWVRAMRTSSAIMTNCVTIRCSRLFGRQARGQALGRSGLGRQEHAQPAGRHRQQEAEALDFATPRSYPARSTRLRCCSAWKLVRGHLPEKQGQLAYAAAQGDMQRAPPNDTRPHRRSDPRRSPRRPVLRRLLDC